MSITLGLLGAGGIARVHADAAHAAGATVVGFCDVVPERARELADHVAAHGSDRGRPPLATTSADELLALPGLDAVVVAAPNHVHAALAIRAMEAGKDVLLEKPMAMSVDECDAIIEAQARTGRVLQMGFVSRCAPAVRAVKELIDAGRFGRVYHARGQWHRRRGIPGLGGWFTTRAESGGGVLIDLGVHVIDLMLHLTGRPRATRVSGSCTSTFGSPIGSYVFDDMWGGPPRPEGTFDVEDAAMGLIRCDGGPTFELAVTWAANVAESTVPSGVMLLGERAGCFFDVWGDRVVVATTEGRRLIDLEPVIAPVEPWADAFRREHLAFQAAVTARREPEACAAHGRAVQAILDAFYRSSDAGREVEVA